MNLRSVSAVAVLAALFVPAFAQSASSEDESSLSLTLPTDEWYVPKSKVSFGMRVLSSGVKAQFGNLGSVASIRSAIAASEGDASRYYDTGYVLKDTPRANEYDANGNVTTTPGTRYKVYRTNDDGTQTLTLDYVAYTPGQAREWRYLNEGQVTNGVLALSSYSARSDGASAAKEEGVNGGIEFSLSRDMGKIGKGRFDWALTAGFALNGINAKTAGSVHSTLVTYTDFFLLNGPAPTRDSSGNLGGPTFVDALEADGTTVANANGIETTTTVGNVPTGAPTQSVVAGAATVKGNWKVKGAYMMLRFGPTVRTQITDRFGVSASIGLAGAYAGTRYSVVEELEIADVLEPINEQQESTETKFVGGYYADLTVDWTASERTGLYAGVNLQSLGSYNQDVAGRTAKIDFGNAIGMRGGINFKF